MKELVFSLNVHNQGDNSVYLNNRTLAVFAHYFIISNLIIDALQEQADRQTIREHRTRRKIVVTFRQKQNFFERKKGEK